MSKTALKDAIKAAFIKQQNPTSQDAALESVSKDISDAIADYVVEELKLLKTKLIDPGAYTSTSLPATSDDGAIDESSIITSIVSPGTITNYNPGIS